MPFGRITTYSLTDAVGRIQLEDGTELKFGASALRNVIPAVDVRVHVGSVAPHPLGGMRALEVEAAESDDSYPNKAAAFVAAASKQQEATRTQTEQDRARLVTVQPDELAPEERSFLERHRREQAEAERRNAIERERAEHLGREAALLLTQRDGRAVFAELLQQCGVRAPDIARLVELGRPAALLVGTRPTHPIECGESKLGGDPDLAPSEAWPEHRGHQLAFLAQIQVEHVPLAVRGSLGLRHDGLLSFFYDDNEQPWGYKPDDRGACRVIFTPGGERLQRRPSSGTRFDELEVRFAQEFRPPAPHSVHVEPLGLDEPTHNAYREAVDAYLDAITGTTHLLGGHARPVQSPVEVEAALASNGAYMGGDQPTGLTEAGEAEISASASHYRLLLQLDSDELMGTMWGDNGSLYFVLRDDALRAGTFDDAWCILQCY